MRAFTILPVRHLALIALFALLPIGVSAAGQAKLFTFEGETAEGSFGYAVDTAGDIDRDGYDDVIVGAVNYGSFRGYVRVFSGRTGALLYAFDEPYYNGTGLGSDVAGGGDANGDGWPDVIIGAYWDSILYHYSGSVRVYSGRDGSLMHTFSGDYSFDQFGLAVAWAGDVDGDGSDDILTGAFGSDANGTDSGVAKVYSGRTGALLHTFPGDRAGDEFGRSVAGIGDVDGDGRPDLLVAGWNSNTTYMTGYARVYSGRDGSVIRTHQGPVGSGYGQSVAGLGDVDGDGIPDYVIGAHVERHPSTPHLPVGAARVYSGWDGSLLYTFWGTPHSTLGYSVAGPGDIDGDGVPDVFVGAPNVISSSGTGRYVVAYSGADGSVIFQLHEGNGQFGNAVGAAGDVNGDGRMDVLVADYKANGEAGPSAGIVYVLGGCCPAPVTYCSAAPSSVGPGASIAHLGGPGVIADNLVLTAEGAVPGRPGLFFYGDGRTEEPFGDGLRCAGGTIFRLDPPLAVGPDGRIARPLDLGSPPAGSGPGAVSPGSTWYFQFAYRDPASPGAGFNSSDALAVTFCP